MVSWAFMKLYSEDPEVIFVTQNKDPFFAFLSNIVFSHATPGPGRRLLDLGCGTGRNVFLAAKRGFEAVGVDYEKKGVTTARTYAKKIGLTEKALFIQADLSELKKRQFGLFDYIILMEVIEHIDDYQKVIDFAYDTLKKGGTLFLTTPNDPKQWTVLDDYAQHKRRFTISEVQKALSKFRKKDIYTVGFPFHRLSLQTYNLVKTFRHTEHNPRDFRASGIITSLYNKVGNVILGIDALFPRTSWGTTIIAIAQK